MSHGSKILFLGLLLLASSACATTVGPVKGMPVAGHALELNIPFAVDRPADRACASANVRYGNLPVPRSTLHVQGSGLKRNLLVTTRANVNGSSVTVNVRVGCGAKAVTRSFVLPTHVPAARSPSVTPPIIRAAAPELAVKARAPRTPVAMAPAEPLFPPPASQADPQESEARNADASLAEELRKARSEASTAVALLAATRKELAAVLDVERRTSQTLIDADRQVRDARSEVARMRLLLNSLAAAMGLAAAGLAWIEFQRAASRRRTPRESPAQEPALFTGLEQPA